MGRSDLETIRKAHLRMTGRAMPGYTETVRIVGRRYRRSVTPLERRMEKQENHCDLQNPVRHLTFHVCPFANSQNAWKWNFEQLQQRWQSFNGIKVLGINVDADTVSSDCVIEYCASINMHWDHVIVRRNNRALGEVMTWLPSLETLNVDHAGKNEIVFSAHAKGVKYGVDMPRLIRNWTGVMYSANLDDLQTIERSLEWFSATGVMRARSARTRFWKFAWYYSGAFWWWRMADVAVGDWRSIAQTYAGREMWIGNQFEKHASDCLFLDGARSPYLPEYWKNVIIPRWKEYQNARPGLQFCPAISD